MPPNMYDLEDTIAAISTPLGAGGIGIVRLSGPAAIPIAERIFVAKAGGSPSRFKSHTLHYGKIIDPWQGEGCVIDEVLLSVMRAPQTYTCQDIVEINAHGGTAVLKRILRLALDAGARLAQPGEFTKRAFLNGRMDLAQAEAVLDVIKAKTDASLRLGAAQLKGNLSLELEQIRAQLLDVLASLEAVVNFPDDGLGAEGGAPVSAACRSIDERLERLLSEGEKGQLLKDGVKAVICGKPNVGKSSLLNALLGNPRAIVSETAGTTRDTIEEPADINGMPFQLVDTAGILEPRDFIEREAVGRSRQAVSQADIVLFVLDASGPLTAADEGVARQVEGINTIVVVNKSDLPRGLPSAQVDALCPGRPAFWVSALTREGIEHLERKIVEAVSPGCPLAADGILVSSVRHLHALGRSRAAVKNVLDLSAKGVPPEFLAEEIKAAIKGLDEITGRDIDGDLLEKIFSSFCVGK